MDKKEILKIREKIIIAKSFLKRHPSTRLVFDENFNAKWFPRLGDRIVMFDGRRKNGFDIKEEALEDAKKFKHHAIKFIEQYKGIINKT